MDMEVKVMKKIVGVILAIFVLLPASLVGELSLKQSVREKLEIVKELAPKAIATHIVISEVFYDETGTDYNEFVELYNPTTAAVDISGWSLKHYNQAGSLQWTRTFPSGATIPKYGFYLIGQKSPLDSTDWGGTAIIPDNLTAGSLQNGPGDYAVLENAAGSYVDGVKWGDDTTVADPPLIQDTPTRSDVAPDVSGDSIERRPGETNSTGGNGVDTDNNLNDFLQRATPEPQNTTSPPETPSEGPPPAEHVTINEILYNSLYPEPAGEFIELYNGNNTTAFCIDGWNISDGEGNWQILNPTSGNDYVIQPKEHVIIANDGTRFFLNYNFYPDFEKSGSTPAVDLSIWETVALKNTGDEVILNNSDGKVIDVVVWELGSYGSVVPYNASEANGESIQRMPEGYEGSETPDATSPTGHDEATENMSSGVFIKGKPTPRSADKNPPTISNVSVDARSTIAVITWKTNDSDIWPEINPYATTEVIYSPNTNPDSTSNLTAIDNAYVTEHGIMLTNLKPSTTY
ncbi:MAG: lamin tail domain-containing protein, partial [Candidatus Thermoplasmatota archaeon]